VIINEVLVFLISDEGDLFEDHEPSVGVKNVFCGITSNTPWHEKPLLTTA